MNHNSVDLSLTWIEALSKEIIYVQHVYGVLITI